MHNRQRLYFPEERPRSAALGRWAVGLLFLGVGLAALATTFLGMPIEWSDGGQLPAWGSLIVGALFTGVGMVMLTRREYAEVDLQRRRVIAWRDLGDTFRTTFPLDQFDAVRVHQWPEDTEHPEGYTLWLTGPEASAFLEAFDDVDEAARRAQDTASAIKLQLRLPRNGAR